MLATDLLDKGTFPSRLKPQLHQLHLHLAALAYSFLDTELLLYPKVSEERKLE